jgi:osmotically-inducible protein OsmY
MMLRRLMLGFTTLCIAAAATGCAEKTTPTPMEQSVQQDRAISERVLNNIKKDVALSDDIDNFQVLTVKGEAMIYGVVDNELERSHAEQIATEVEGVRGVTSRIRLSNQPVQTAAGEAAAPVN